MTIVETARVLARAYDLTATEIAWAIERTLQASVLVVEHAQEILAAMIALKRGRGSFVDALIGGLAAPRGCSHTVSFDRKAARLSGFQPL